MADAEHVLYILQYRKTPEQETPFRIGISSNEIDIENLDSASQVAYLQLTRGRILN